MSDNKTAYKDIISANALQSLLPEPVIFDCRARLGDPGWGQTVYNEGHIEGALYLNLDSDLATPPSYRGRHPLPERSTWLATVQRLGVNNTDQVVLYDDASGAFAARGWWMFRWLGHTNVAVLDGGLNQWQLPLVQDRRSPERSNFQAGAPLTRQINTETLSASLNTFGENLIDARTETRFRGEEEPIDPVAGHIPGAHCRPFQANLNPDGCFLSATDLKARFESFSQDAVCYCGSGVTACHNILAMHIAGLPEPTLYADSWSGWITDPERPVSTA